MGEQFRATFSARFENIIRTKPSGATPDHAECVVHALSLSQARAWAISTNTEHNGDEKVL